MLSLWTCLGEYICIEVVQVTRYVHCILYYVHGCHSKSLIMVHNNFVVKCHMNAIV